MPNTVDNAFVRTFESNVRFLAQQSDTRLRKWVDEVSERSEDHVWETLGAIDPEQKVGRLVSTPVADSPWDNRLASIATYHAGDTSEQEDISQMLIDPNSKLTKNLAMAMRRQVDDIIITAATATAYDKDGGTTVWDSGQTIGNGAGVISLDFITEVMELFDSNDIDEDERKVFVIGPTQKRKMLQLLEVTSADFQTKKALADGYLPNFMGFDWIISNRLLIPTGGQLNCLAFTKWGLGLHVAKDIWARVAEDPSASFAWRIYTALSMGAVRVEDKHVVKAHLKDSMS
jgi:hypothetical protein